MTRDDIIRIAKEAWLRRTGCVWTEPQCWSKAELVRFAELISAAEREKVAAWMMQRGYATGHGDTTEDLLKELEWQIREQERELIARSMNKQADLACDYLDRKWAQEMAEAIRASGKQ